jgi:hypothetical protein
MSLLAFGACGSDDKKETKPNTDKCTSNAQCDSGEKCSADGVCVADTTTGGCTSNAQCASDEKCQSGVCVADTTTGGCTSNAQCASDEKCQSGVCVPDTTTGGCTSNAQCASDEICQSGVCVSAGGDNEGTCDKNLSEFAGKEMEGEGLLYDYGCDPELGCYIEVDFFAEVGAAELFVNINEEATGLSVFSFQNIAFESFILVENDYPYCNEVVCAAFFFEDTVYEALSGNLTMTSIDPTFAGEFSNAVFYDWTTAEWDDYGYVANSCETPPISFSFTGPLEDGSFEEAE